MENKAPSLKVKIICVAMAVVMALIAFIAGKLQMSVYNNLTENCTAQVTGVVDNRAQGRILRDDPAVTKYLSGIGRNHHWIHIKVTTDDVFKTGEIYADLGSERLYEVVYIHYDPNDPGEYYLGSRIHKYKDYAVTLYLISGLVALGTLLLAWAVFRKKPERPAQKNLDSEI